MKFWLEVANQTGNTAWYCEHMETSNYCVEMTQSDPLFSNIFIFSKDFFLFLTLTEVRELLEGYSEKKIKLLKNSYAAAALLKNRDWKSVSQLPDVLETSPRPQNDPYDDPNWPWKFGKHRSLFVFKASKNHFFGWPHFESAQLYGQGCQKCLKFKILS